MKAWSGALLLVCLWMVAETSAQKTNCPCGSYIAPKKGRIINGKQTIAHQYPWVVRMIFDADLYQFCDASIISEKVAITNALCTNEHAKNNPISVVAGSADADNPGQVVPVERYISHEKYSNPPNKIEKIENDIALLLLAKPLKFNSNVVPICLPTGRMNLDGQWAKILGWGALIPDSKIKSKYLMEIDVEIKPFSYCKSLANLQESQNIICTMGTKNTVSRGDSGSPVAYLDPAINAYTLIGMVSFADSSNTSDPVFQLRLHPTCPGSNLKSIHLDVTRFRRMKDEKYVTVSFNKYLFS